jgi:hypothetical protein
VHYSGEGSKGHTKMEPETAVNWLHVFGKKPDDLSASVDYTPESCSF